MNKRSISEFPNINGYARVKYLKTYASICKCCRQMYNTRNNHTGKCLQCTRLNRSVAQPEYVLTCDEDIEIDLGIPKGTTPVITKYFSRKKNLNN